MLATPLEPRQAARMGRRSQRDLGGEAQRDRKSRGSRNKWGTRCSKANYDAERRRASLCRTGRGPGALTRTLQAWVLWKLWASLFLLGKVFNPRSSR